MRLLLPLPLAWDLELTGWLQELASRAASRLLDRLAVDHCRMGYLIEVPGYRHVASCRSGCERPHQRSDHHGQNPNDDAQWHAESQVVGRAIAARSSDHQIRLIPDRTCKAGG